MYQHLTRYFAETPTHDLPFRPVLSGSTWASFTAPSSINNAYRFDRSPPNTDAPSNDKSRDFVNSKLGSGDTSQWLFNVYALQLAYHRGSEST
jgi:hypothetical protein